MIRCRCIPAQPGLRLTGLGGDCLACPAAGSAVANVGGDVGVTQAGGDVSRTLLRLMTLGGVCDRGEAVAAERAVTAWCDGPISAAIAFTV